MLCLNLATFAQAFRRPVEVSLPSDPLVTSQVSLHGRLNAAPLSEGTRNQVIAVLVLIIDCGHSDQSD